VDNFDLIYALFEFSKLNGVYFSFEDEVKEIEQDVDSLKVITSKGSYEASCLVNAAGLWADEVLKLAGGDARFELGKGVLIVFDRAISSKILAPLYLRPDPKTKGGAIMFTHDGKGLWGPNLRFTDNKEDTSSDEQDLDMLLEKFSGQVDLELEIVKEGHPMLLSVEGLDLAYGAEMSEKLNAGLCVVKGLLKRYDDGCEISRKSLLRVKRRINGLGKVISLSPEASHSLDIPFFLEEVSNFPVRLNYRGPIHIPCLLMEREDTVLRGLISIGASPAEVLRDICMKIDVPQALALCPRASSLGIPCFYDLLEFINS